MSNHRLVRSLALFAAVLSMMGSAAARAADTAKEAEGVGEAAIVNGDEAAAKEKAKKAALRDALEKTMGTYVAATSESKDFQSVAEHVMSSTEGYVKSYDVVDTKKDGDTITVKVKAMVDKGHIDQDLQAKHVAITAMKFPRLAVLVAEQNIGQAGLSMSIGPQGASKSGTLITTDERVVENTLIDEWKKDDFTFVDPEALSGTLKAANVVMTDPSKIDPRVWTKLSDSADVVIVGTGIATGQGDLTKELGGEVKEGGLSMKSCKALISLRVFNTDNGEILATDQKTKTNLNIQETVCGHDALISASKMISASLQKKILTEWNKRLNGGARVRLSVTGVPSLSVLTQFKAALKEMRGVQSVDQKSFSKGAADIDLRLEGGDAEGFAGDLDQKKIGNVVVKVTGQTASTVTVEFSSK